MTRQWRKVEGMGRNELIAELVELRKFHDEKTAPVKLLCDCDQCSCNNYGVSCRGRCLDCEENCDG